MVDLSTEVVNTSKKIEKRKQDYKEWLKKQKPVDRILRFSLIFFIAAFLVSLYFLIRQ